MLTETSVGAGTQLLRDGLVASGYHVFGEQVAGDRGSLVASRIPVTSTLTEHLNVSLPHRAVGIVLDTNPKVSIVGIYVPSRDRSPVKIEKKRAFIDSLITSLARFPRELRDNTLMLGDYNVIARDHAPALPGYFPYEYAMHDSLKALGFATAHNLSGDKNHPHSWIGRTGNGYLYDYVHAGPGLHDSIVSCNYVHEVRSLGLSDHAAVTTTWHVVANKDALLAA